MVQLDYQNYDDARKETGILRSMFGPSRREVWSQLAQLVHGTYVQGGFIARDKVIVNVDQWTVTLDTYTESSGG